MRWLVGSGSLFLLPLLAGVAHADERPVAPRLELTGSVHALLGTGDICERTASDVVECTSMKGYAGAGLGLRGRLGRFWSVGVSGAYDWSTWTDGITPRAEETRVQSRLWFAAADGRWHFLGGEPFDPYVELVLGLAKSWSVAELLEGGTGHSPGMTAPSAGTALGVDCAVLRHFSLGAALRAQYLAFERQNLSEQRESGSVYSGATVVWSLGLGATGYYP
jgi:hypothetical protein